MSKPISITETLNLYPTGIDTSASSYSTADNNANAQTDTSSTSYSTINLTTGASVSSWVTYTFNIGDSDIPVEATITSVACQIKARVSSTSYITSAVAQLYAGNTAKGNTADFRSNTTSPSPTSISNTGTWTIAELKTACIRYTATRGTSNTSRTASMNIYGTDLNITYSLNGTAYTINTSSTVNDVTITPATQDIFQGNSGIVLIDTGNDSQFNITDNNVDISNQLVLGSNGGNETYIPSSYTNLSNGITINTSYPITRAYHDSSQTSEYARLDFSTSTTGYIELLFDFSEIPSNAIITSLIAKARLRISSTSRITNRICQLYANSTAKGSNIDFTSTSSGGAVVTLTPGTWTRSELDTLKMRIGATSSSSTQSKYIYIYGADIAIEYTIAGKHYTYTISNISADHTILIKPIGSSDKLLIKLNGSWQEVSKIYLKQNGSWIEQSLSYLSDNNITNLKQG